MLPRIWSKMLIENKGGDYPNFAKPISFSSEEVWHLSWSMEDEKGSTIKLLNKQVGAAVVTGEGEEPPTHRGAVSAAPVTHCPKVWGNSNLTPFIWFLDVNLHAWLGPNVYWNPCSQSTKRTISLIWRAMWSWVGVLRVDRVASSRLVDCIHFSLQGCLMPLHTSFYVSDLLSLCNSALNS